MGLVVDQGTGPGFYARQDMRTPVRIAVGVLVLTQVFNAIFVFVLATAASRACRCRSAWAPSSTPLLLLRACASSAPTRRKPGWVLFLLRVLIASAAMGALQWWLAGHVDWVGAARAADCVARRLDGG